MLARKKKKKKICKNCRYWKELSDAVAFDEYGECLFNPPSNSGTDWPRPHFDKWCGKFRAKKRWYERP